MNRITNFRGDYRWLSNFYQSPIELRGVVFPSSEAAYQATKAQDYALDPIFCKLTPGQAKKLGKNILIREDWDDIKLEVMENILRLKFAEESLKQRLLDTGDAEIYEGNSWGDDFWGCSWDTLEGENNLGKLLMKLRDEYRNTKPRPSLDEILKSSGHDVQEVHEGEVPE